MFVETELNVVNAAKNNYHFNVRLIYSFTLDLENFLILNVRHFELAAFGLIISIFLYLKYYSLSTFSVLSNLIDQYFCTKSAHSIFTIHDLRLGINKNNSKFGTNALRTAYTN